MDNKIMETLENLEDKIESIKWLITPLYMKGSGPSESINVIKKSAGILGKDFPKGTVFENKARSNWNTDFSQRIK